MTRVRAIARSAFLTIVLAYVLALSGLAGARLVGHHAGEAHATAGLRVICAEHGLTLPAGDTDGQPDSSSGCPCGPACPFKTFVSAALIPAGPAWIAIDAATVAYSSTPFRPVGSRAPPDLTARGPPVLI